MAARGPPWNRGPLLVAGGVGLAQPRGLVPRKPDRDAPAAVVGRRLVGDHVGRSPRRTSSGITWATFAHQPHRQRLAPVARLGHHVQRLIQVAHQSKSQYPCGRAARPALVDVHPQEGAPFMCAASGCAPPCLPSPR